MKNYDFALLREDGLTTVYTGCIIRRYCAAMTDIIVMCVLLILYGMTVPIQNPHINGIVFLVFLLGFMYLPEVLMRQTFGMFLFNVVVIVPPKKDPVQTLLIRRFVNLLEFAMPFFVYFYYIALTKNHRSISDSLSGCMIARKKYIITGKAKGRVLTVAERFLIPTIFILGPFLAIILFIVALQNDTFFEYFLRFLKMIGAE